MNTIRAIDELAQHLAALVPGNLGAAQDDLAKTFKGALHAGLTRLNLVSREEFDVQKLVLLRTREKVEQLERQVTALEAALNRIQRPN
jgi:hypothetical protein